MERNEMPVGFAMALAQNSEAMQILSLLSEEKKQKIITGIHSIRSRDDMRRYVNALVSDEP